MPRVTFIKKARKDNPAAKAGESYWLIEFRFGGNGYSRERPKPSQLTQSPFLSEYHSIQEDLQEALNNYATVEDVEMAVEDAKQRITDLGDETQGNLDDMPEQFEDTREMMEARVDGLEAWESDLDGLDFTLDDGADDDTKTEAIGDMISEIEGFDPGLE